MSNYEEMISRRDFMKKAAVGAALVGSGVTERSVAQTSPTVKVGLRNKLTGQRSETLPAPFIHNEEKQESTKPDRITG